MTPTLVCCTRPILPAQESAPSNEPSPQPLPASLPAAPSPSDHAAQVRAATQAYGVAVGRVGRGVVEVLKVLATALVACKEGASLRGVGAWARRTFGPALYRSADGAEAWDVHLQAAMVETPVSTLSALTVVAQSLSTLTVVAQWCTQHSDCGCSVTDSVSLGVGVVTSQLHLACDSQECAAAE